MARTPQRHAPPEARAIGRRMRVSPRKLNLVAGLIRGKVVQEAQAELLFCKRRIADDVLKVLKSAIANAENNEGMEVDWLYVAEAYVGRNLVMKRIRPRARGRAARIKKPFSQITIVLRESGGRF
ncbi:MAG: 50S ribosomal protein L22 [Rhodobacteraceae bacterium]|nr:50S ribosomal protein L22 [Paracoccaceae bacterium]